MNYVIKFADQLAAHLKSLRKARGLTQAQLGERLGVKQVRMGEIEKNPGSISVEQLMRLLTALEIELHLVEPQHVTAPHNASDDVDKTTALQTNNPPKGEW
jgi:HTH-type transcriptional regulator / antitoxin HipB